MHPLSLVHEFLDKQMCVSKAATEWLASYTLSQLALDREESVQTCVS